MYTCKFMNLTPAHKPITTRKDFIAAHPVHLLKVYTLFLLIVLFCAYISSQYSHHALKGKKEKKMLVIQPTKGNAPLQNNHKKDHPVYTASVAAHASYQSIVSVRNLADFELLHETPAVLFKCIGLIPPARHLPDILISIILPASISTNAP